MEEIKKADPAMTLYYQSPSTAWMINLQHHLPYSLVSTWWPPRMGNNCLSKSWRIRKVAKAVGLHVETLVGLSWCPADKGKAVRWYERLPLWPHVWLIVEGVEVDVSLDLESEKRMSFSRMLWSLNVSKMIKMRRWRDALLS
jgi:hypothetical protein